MSRAVTAIRWGLTACGGAVVLAGVLVGPARAQSTDCGVIQKTLAERQSLVQQANAGSGKKVKLTAQQACGLFTKLSANGSGALKWIDTNKEWCSVPDSFATGFREDHQRVLTLRTKICGAAAQQAQLERKARTQAQNSDGGLLGGPGLTGSFKVPQGAL